MFLTSRNDKGLGAPSQVFIQSKLSVALQQRDSVLGNSWKIPGSVALTTQSISPLSCSSHREVRFHHSCLSASKSSQTKIISSNVSPMYMVFFHSEFHPRKSYGSRNSGAISNTCFSSSLWCPSPWANTLKFWMYLWFGHSSHFC